MQVVHAFRISGCFPSGVYRRQQQSHQYTNDRDHDQQLNDCESGSATTAQSPQCGRANTQGYFILRQFRRQRELATSREKILTYFESRTETQFAGAAAHRLRAADISTAMRAAGHAVNPSSEQ
jgi:hypothetical protein